MKTMADQNEITDTPNENEEETTENTLKASVDKEQPLQKSKGLSKKTDKQRRNSLLLLILPLLMRAVKVILTVRVILVTQVALKQLLSVKKSASLSNHVNDTV